MKGSGVTQQVRDAFRWALKSDSPVGLRLCEIIDSSEPIVPERLVEEALAEWDGAGRPEPPRTTGA